MREEDFEQAFESNDSVILEESDTSFRRKETSDSAIALSYRRRIEELLEEKRMRQELEDYDDEEVTMPQVGYNDDFYDEF